MCARPQKLTGRKTKSLSHDRPGRTAATEPEDVGVKLSLEQTHGPAHGRNVDKRARLRNMKVTPITICLKPQLFTASSTPTLCLLACVPCPARRCSRAVSCPAQTPGYRVRVRLGVRVRVDGLPCPHEGVRPTNTFMLRKRARFSPFRPCISSCVGSKDSDTPTSSGSVAAVRPECLWDGDFVSRPVSFCVGVHTLD